MRNSGISALNTPAPPVIGVLGLQGAFQAHIDAVQRCGAQATWVRYPDDLDDVDGLIIPGGESTTVGRLLERTGMMEPVRRRALAGTPVFGTCMGLIVLAQRIEGLQQPTLGLLDVLVRRNAFGRQVDSFEADLAVTGIDGAPVRGVFIRAPAILETGPQVEVLARHDDFIVVVRQGNLLGAAFHPELTDDPRVHQLFLQMVIAGAQQPLAGVAS